MDSQTTISLNNEIESEEHSEEERTALIDGQGFERIQFQGTSTNDRRRFVRRIKKPSVFQSNVRNRRF